MQSILKWRLQALPFNGSEACERYRNIQDCPVLFTFNEAATFKGK